MRTKEVQLLAILAVISGTIIALSMWTGRGDDSRKEADKESDAPEIVESDELDQLFESLDGGRQTSESGRREQEDSELAAEDGDSLLSPFRRRASDQRGAGSLSTLPGRDIDDRLAETPPEEIPLKAENDSETSEDDTDTEQVKHTVKRGDTLSGISQKYYGTSGKWREILEANQNVLQDASQLRPDMSLVIPDAREVSVSTDENDDSSKPSQDAKGEKYTVQRGDTLWGLAMKFYNDGTRHRKILEANKDKLSDGDRLSAGMEIIIPE